MKLPENISIGNIETYTSTVKAARKVLKEHKKNHRKEIDMYRLRIDKTIYCFNSYEKLQAKLKELEVTEYETAKPGEQLPVKKLKL